MPYIGNPIYQSAFVTDQFSGDGSTVAYTMSVAPAGVSNVLVAVSGVLQDPSTYGVSGNTLTFSAAPPSGTGNISVRYLGVPVTGVVTTAYRTVTEFTATASQTTFTPPSYTVGFINVYLNGVLLASTDYTATNGTTVVLTTGASAGNILTVESFRVESVANAIPNAAGAVSSSNLASGIVTPAKLSTGGLYWDTSSNVGIGTTAPTYQLELKSADPRIALNNTGTGTWFTSAGWTGSNDYSIVQAGVAERMRLTSAGNLNITTANAGIVFNKTTGGLNNQTLNDYESGSFTITDYTGSGVTFTPANGPYYIKIGRLCYVSFYINVNATSSANTPQIAGLPFTADNSYYYLIGRVTNAVSATPYCFQINANSNNATLNSQIGSPGITWAQQSGNYWLFSGCYMTAS